MTTGWRSHLLPGLTLMAVCFVVYAGTLGHGFLQNWDDAQYVVENPAIRGFSVANIAAAFTSLNVGNYAPLPILSYTLDYSLWGLDPRGYHLTNIILQGACATALYALLWSIYRRRDLALLAALFFAVHPVQVETVAWVSQRKNLLAMFFYLLAALGYLVAEESGAKRWYFLSLAAFVCALLSKSVAVVLPLFLLLLDLGALGTRWEPRLLVNKAPYVLLAAACALAAVITQQGSHGGGRTDFHGGGGGATFFTMLPVFVTYLRMVVWPGGLSAVYDPPLRHSLLEPAVLGALIFLTALFAVSLVSWRRHRERALWFWSAAIGILPVSQLIPITTLMNDRYLYFPMIGFAAFFGCIFTSSADTARPWLRRSAQGGALLCLIALALVAQRRAAVWHDALSLWSDAVVKAPGNQYAHQGLAEVLERRGELERAAAEYEAAIRLDPTSAELHNQLGVVRSRLGQPDRAVDALREAVRLKPGHYPFAFNLGVFCLEAGRLREARDVFIPLLTRAPADSRVACILAGIAAKLGDGAEAGRYREQAIAGNPAEAPALCDDFARSMGAGLPGTGRQTPPQAR
ncbi:MAG TPA: tetratricopeptide repeat protein [Geobacteraceae bacterium]